MFYSAPSSLSRAPAPFANGSEAPVDHNAGSLTSLIRLTAGDARSPLLLRDGRRLWRWRAAAIPAAPGAEARDAGDRARWCGCTIVADGCDLILVEPWLSRLPPEVRDALAADPGAAIAVLRIGRTP